MHASLHVALNAIGKMCGRKWGGGSSRSSRVAIYFHVINVLLEALGCTSLAELACSLSFLAGPVWDMGRTAMWTIGRDSPGFFYIPCGSYAVCCVGGIICIRISARQAIVDSASIHVVRHVGRRSLKQPN